MRFYNDLHKLIWVFIGWLCLSSAYWLLVGGDIRIVFVIVSAVILLMDCNYVSKAGVPQWYSFFALLLPPVYLILRAIKLWSKGGNIYIAALLMVIFLPAALYDAVYKNTEIEESACHVVSDLLKTDLKRPDLSCKNVDIQESTDDGFHVARVLLSSGDDIKITIQERDTGDIWVEVPPQIMK